MSDTSKDPRSANLSCPICDEPITVSINWETETGEFGTILSRWPEMDDDPDTIDQHGGCRCDFSKPLAEALASYLNDNERLEQILFPPPEEPIVSIHPRKMTPAQATQLHEIIVLAETLAFDIHEMVKGTGHKIEQNITMAVHCLATASDLAELNATRVQRLVSGGTAESLTRTQLEDISLEELTLLRRVDETGEEGLRLGDLFERPLPPAEPPLDPPATPSPSGRT